MVTRPDWIIRHVSTWLTGHVLLFQVTSFESGFTPILSETTLSTFIICSSCTANCQTIHLSPESSNNFNDTTSKVLQVMLHLLPRLVAAQHCNTDAYTVWYPSINSIDTSTCYIYMQLDCISSSFQLGQLISRPWLIWSVFGISKSWRFSYRRMSWTFEHMQSSIVESSRISLEEILSSR